MYKLLIEVPKLSYYIFAVCNIWFFAMAWGLSDKSNCTLVHKADGQHSIIILSIKFNEERVLW